MGQFILNFAVLIHCSYLLTHNSQEDERGRGFTTIDSENFIQSSLDQRLISFILPMLGQLHFTRAL